MPETGGIVPKDSAEDAPGHYWEWTMILTQSTARFVAKKCIRQTFFSLTAEGSASAVVQKSASLGATFARSILLTTLPVQSVQDWSVYWIKNRWPNENLCY